MESGFVFDGKPHNAIGSNDANNVFDSSLVVANNDGSVLERLEYVTTVLAGIEPVTFTPSSAPSVDEDGGRVAVGVSIVDANTGPIASGSIDITGITIELAKSTAGGAFSTVGVTQPAGATKSAGLVELEFDFDAAEWAVGDKYRLKVGSVTATVGSTAYHMGTLTWVGEVVEDLDVKTTVDDIDTDIGEPGDANTAATLHGRHKVPDADSNDNTLLRDVVGNKTDAGVQDHTDTTASLMGLLRGAHEELGQNTEAATDPSAATGTLFAKLRGIGVEVDLPAADSAANATIGDVVGNKDDAGSAAATASTHALARLLVDVYAGTSGTADSGSTTTLVDAALTQADADYWAGQMLVMLTGAAAGQARTIVDFDPGTDTVRVGRAFTQAVGTGDDYVIVSYDASDAIGVGLNATGVSIATNSLADQLYIGAAEQLRTFIAKTGGTPVAATKSLVDAVGHTGSAFLTSGLGNSIWQSEAATPASDASVGSGAEENLLDKGADAGTPRYKLESALCNVASMGSNTSITFRLKSEINGTLTQVGNDVDRTGTGAFDLMSLLGVTNFASRHIRVTVTGDNAADDGSVAATFVTSKGGN